MKNNVRIIFALLLVALLLCGSALAADGSVKYEGGAEKFVFAPGSAYQPTDLFDNFKGVLPGDTIVQNIRVENSTSGKVRIYMRAEPVSAADEDFLNQLHMEVKAADAQIFDAQAGQQGNLATNTLLGTFRKNGGTDLTVTLTVPVELGNEFMDRIGTVPWTFLAEEIAEDDTPDTGDWFQGGIWFATVALIALALVFVLVARRRHAEAK